MGQPQEPSGGVQPSRAATPILREVNYSIADAKRYRMKIRSINKDVKDVLESGFYRIPRFQRPYSWDPENLEDFWNDVTKSRLPHPSHFNLNLVSQLRRRCHPLNVAA